MKKTLLKKYGLQKWFDKTFDKNEKKNKNWLRVIELCENAKAQGWGGDWDKRIDEAMKNV